MSATRPMRRVLTRVLVRVLVVSCCEHIAEYRRDGRCPTCSSSRTLNILNVDLDRVAMAPHRAPKLNARRVRPDGSGPYLSRVPDRHLGATCAPDWSARYGAV